MSSISLKDPVSTSGKWVERSEFNGKKSFGYFECDGCSGKSWVTAHAFKQYKQACKSCNQYSLAVYMWVNLERRESRGGRDEEEGKPPHLRHLCEACKLGVCRL